MDFVRVAIVGSGISGLVCAYLLSRKHQVTLFEREGYLGGHTNTVDVEHRGQPYAIDTGFIVYNEHNYPGFTRLLELLQVKSHDTEMSFSVRCERTHLEYNGHTLNTLFAQRRNLLRPGFYRMLRDILRFYRETPALLEQPDDGSTVREYLERERYSEEFVQLHLLPMGAAIWSTDLVGTGEFPLRTFVAFFHRHGFLRVSDRPQWRVIDGGSRSYVQALRGALGQVRLEHEVQEVVRGESHVEVRGAQFREQFDKAIIATHSDQALALLGDASPEEREVLGAIRYQSNTAVLHTDPRFLPRRRRAWASWNYHVLEEPTDRPTVTYNMNILQGLQAPVQFCVTLNRENDIDPAQILRVIEYAHPLFDTDAVAARDRYDEVSGSRNTYYCGAYWGDGFHEDGVQSALRVCRDFGEELA